MWLCSWSVLSRHSADLAILQPEDAGRHVGWYVLDDLHTLNTSINIEYFLTVKCVTSRARIQRALDAVISGILAAIESGRELRVAGLPTPNRDCRYIKEVCKIAISRHNLRASSAYSSR